LVFGHITYAGGTSWESEELVNGGLMACSYLGMPSLLIQNFTSFAFIFIFYFYFYFGTLTYAVLHRPPQSAIGLLSLFPWTIYVRRDYGWTGALLALCLGLEEVREKATITFHDDVAC
jgi:hypothetical protein